VKSSLLLYVATILIFTLGVYFVLSFGSRLESGASASAQRDMSSPTVVPFSGPDWLEGAWNTVGKALRENQREPLGILLLQVTVILIATRLIGGFFFKLGQPPVIGEMIAGIILGPSLLGLIFPKTFSFLFPPSSMGALSLLGQIGSVLFMFVVGMETNAKQLKEKARAAIIISHASIIAPFFLGVTISLLIYRLFAPPDISFTSFALFLGAAMSVTAFPVLARIIEDRGISDSHLGQIAIACAAVDDVTAWCVLALVIAIVKAQGVVASVMTVTLALTFTMFMLYILKPRLNRITGAGFEGEKKNMGLVGALALVFISAYLTSAIGIHALFGAFLAGAVMPAAPEVRFFLRDKIANFSVAALLPLFFAFTGLRTQIGLLNDWQSWLAGAGIIAVAVVGKLGGSTMAARWAGMKWSESISIGVLLNTRGLMELVVLNIGHDLGILSGRIFAIMVLMALITTCMTGPLLSLVELVTGKGIKQERLATAA
jgi:K+:H+ antiporter